MPIVNIYVDNETYIEFLQKTKLGRERIRKDANKTIIQETKKEVKQE